MLRLRLVRTSAFALSVLAMASWAVSAPAVGQTVEGVITNVDLVGEPRHITIRQADGQSVDVRVHVSTSRISFLDARDAGASPELSNLKSQFPELPAVMIAAQGTLEAAVSAMRGGAEDILLKPCTAEAIEVVIHPESIVHSLVEYLDGSVLAQLGNPDMRTPIAQALAWPERISSGVAAARIASVIWIASSSERGG